MPTSRELAAAFDKKNIYEIDYDYLRSRMEKIMNSTSRAKLDGELKKMFCKIFLEEAIDYEKFRRPKTYSAMNGSLDPMETERVFETSNEMDFLIGYAQIATECAKELTPNYQPQFMFGMTQAEIKDAFKKQLGSYTRRDEARHDLVNIHGVRNCMEDIENARVDYKTGKVRDYEKESERVKGFIREAYVRKEIIKGELRSMGLWDRWFSRRARELRTFIKASEKALKDVKFTRQGVKDAIAEFNAPAARNDDVKNIYAAVDIYYSVKLPPIIKNSMFTIGYRPSLANINEHIKCAREVGKMVKEDNGKLSAEAKAVFEKNFEKLKLVTDAMKGKGISPAEADRRCTEIENEMSKKYAKYKPVTIDAFSESNAEKEKADVKIDDVQKDTAEKSPKHEEPTVTKEPVVKENI